MYLLTLLKACMICLALCLPIKTKAAVPAVWSTRSDAGPLFKNLKNLVERDYYYYCN